MAEFFGICGVHELGSCSHGRIFLGFVGCPNSGLVHMAEFLVVYGTLVCGLARSEPQVPDRQGATPPGRACQGRQVRFGICGVRLLTPARLLTARLAAAAAPAARARGSATPVDRRDRGK